MRLAAIDIGSNAARLLIVEVKGNKARPEFAKLVLLRIPLRLGFDVFANGKIGDAKRKMFLHMMTAFSELIKLYKVDAFKAYATSAMRNAKNSDDIIRSIKKQSGIKIKIISGKKEADLLFQIHAAEKIDKRKSYLYMNVGGGSTELSVFANGKSQEDCSFEIGTIRLLKNNIKKTQWNGLKNEVETFRMAHHPHAIIGTGGNINKVFSLSKTKSGEPLSLSTLNKLYRKLSSLTTEQRMKKFDLNEDRADVIVPALEIYLSVMRWSKAKLMYVPKVGLVDGIIYQLYTDLKGG